MAAKKPAKKSTKKSAKKPALRVGFGLADVTPPLPFPMAGYVHKQERLAVEVRDPLTARAVAFSDGKKTAVVASVDLLLISIPLREGVRARLVERGVKIDGLLLSATHTHSSTGAFVDRPSTKPFMGVYRPAIFEQLVAGITDAVAEAVADLQAATLTFGQTQTTNLNWNRRHKDGPVDRAMMLLTAKRKGPDVHVISFGAHPVVVAEREHYAASADYPAELCKTFENRGDRAMFVVGPVGGVNVLFPEGPMDLDVHMELLLRLMREQMADAAKAAKPVKLGKGVSFGLGQTRLSIATPALFPPRLAWLDALAMPLRLYVRRFASRSVSEDGLTEVPVVRVGDVVYTGYPADLGAGVGLATRRIIEEAGLHVGAVASQTGDYVGYVHMPDDYERYENEDKVARWLTIYENAMAFTGRDTGLNLLEGFKRAFAAALEK